MFRSSDDNLKNENSCLLLVIYVPFTAIGENRQAFGGQTAYLHPRGVIYRSNESDNRYMSLLCILFHSRQRNEWTLTRRTSPGMMTSLLLRLSEACRVKTILDLNYTKYVLLTTLIRIEIYRVLRLTWGSPVVLLYKVFYRCKTKA